MSAERRGRFCRLALLLLLAGWIGGCGFQLRGRTVLAPGWQPLYIDDRRPLQAPALSLTTALRDALRASGIGLSENPSDAAAKLNLLQLDYQRRTLATGSAGAVREYLLTYRVEFSLTDRSGRLLAGPETLSVNRDILYDETAPLGAVAGEDLSRQLLAADAAAALLRRLPQLRPPG